MDERLREKLRAGVAAQQGGRLEEAEAAYRGVLEADARNPFALQYLAAIEAQRGHPQRALDLFDRALEAKPDYADAHNNRGAALKQLGRTPEALAAVARAIELDPEYADAHNNQGVLLQVLGRLAEAVQSFDRAIARAPGLLHAHANRGDALRALGRFDAALESYARAVALAPRTAKLHYNQGVVLAALGRHEEAIASYDRALALDPVHAAAHNNRGVALAALRRLEPALASYDRALQCLPGYAEAHNNRGNVLRDLQRAPEALESYAFALQSRPGYADALYNRGLLLEDFKRLEEAAASYDDALAADPGYPYLLGTCLHARMQICDWTSYATQLQRLSQAIDAGLKAAPPFAAMTLLDVPAVQRKASDTWVRDKHPANDALGPFARGAGRAKIRVGYFSADYHEHASMYLMVEMFEKHDRSRFELVAFSFGPDKDDAMRRRAVRAFDEFHDVRTRSDVEIARLSRDAQVDIAVDLKGFTRDSRAAIFAFRAAPVQVAYMGFPATTAAPYMDYLVADDVVVSPDTRAEYAERIISIPVSYMVNDSRRFMPTAQPSRVALGLPQSAFVFCSFNNNFKITPEVFDAWTRILGAVEGSVLWLLEDNPAAARNLRGHAEQRGIDPRRLVFAPRLPLDEHLARHRAADLFLDTLPCNAHTTASDALWAGLPVLTRKGTSFAGRIAASVVAAVDLPELITTSMHAYEETAVALARDPQRLGVLRQRLDRTRRSSALFDAAPFVRHLEAAFQHMHDRYRAGLAPEDFRPAG